MTDRARNEAIEELQKAIELLEYGENLSAFNVLQDAQRGVLEVLLMEAERDT